MDYPKTPNIDKFDHFMEKYFIIQQFLEYLESMEIAFCQGYDKYPLDKEQCLKDFTSETINIDFNKLQEEEREMVKYISEQTLLNIEENSKNKA